LPAASPAPVFDDENETTSVFEPSAAGKLLGQSSIPQYAVPTRPRNTRPPSLSPAQKAASLRTAAPSVIIQEDTPAALEQRPSSGPSSSVFHWGKEWSAVRKVAVAATAAGILAGLLIVLFGRSAPSPESASSDNEAARAAPAARPEPPASGTTAEPVAAATEAKAEQERQLELTEPPPADSARVKPAETPPSAGRGSARAASRAKVAREPRANPSVSAPSEEDPAPEVEEEGGAELRERSEPAERRGSGREASRGGKAPVEDDELLVNPYSGSPSAEATASAPNAAPTKAPAAAKATSSKTSRDCKKPYYLDADGIRRVKPECL
jgi:hypothetical protein